MATDRQYKLRPSMIPNKFISVRIQQLIDKVRASANLTLEQRTDLLYIRDYAERIKE